ncbi:ABC transporter permease [Anoxybacter fermentans]|uniref:ABC transporter permease n=1 Tax=Anoxybacter fermentans TaxID=1323375 RepID=A0A3S9T2T6_9FIRM|nr:ABC transporter permease [Anoxybacter fermentans]
MKGGRPKQTNSNTSELARREQRLAYTLLLPTFIILALIAFYPLGQVFYTSFTDKTFASGEKTHFIGFDNYKRLLSITIKELPPIIDEKTGKQKIDPRTGEKLYERAIRVLPRKPIRYRELTQFSLFGKRYVIGATDRDFIQAIWNTISFTVISVLAETILGLGIALVMNSNFKGRGIMRATMLVPWAVITVVSARIWEFMLAPSRIGFFNMIFEKLGIGDGNMVFLSNKSIALPTLIIVDVWKTTPFMALLILAGLQLIPKSIYEAAKVDGASPIRQFFSITLPLLKPSLAVALVFRTLDALRVFDIFQVLLAQKTYSMASYNYYQLIGNRAMGLASAIGVIIFIIIFGFAVLYMKLLGVDTE